MATAFDGWRDKYLVENVPPAIFYIPEFISKEEEEYLMRHVNEAPKPKWTQLSNRRLQNWGGLPHSKGMIQEPLPDWLKVYSKKVASLGVFENKVPNHVLVNEYLPGQGIMPHVDGPLYFPTVSTISLGSHTFLDFYHEISHSESEEQGACCSNDQEKSLPLEDRHFVSLLLEPRSLVLVTEDMYKIKLHGIDEAKKDIVTDRVANLNLCQAKLGDILERDTRVSLTIRYVPKVIKNNLIFGKR